ncbi:MAG TPA: cation:proton antiporter [Candidatus Dormibacteraeota bacterium]|jgi:Kef-type K+ transport system membrane component KefB
MPPLSPVALLFLELATILLACRLMGAIAGRLGQAPVLGQMVAGVILGPSLFGLLLPHVQGAVFPAGALAALNALGQIGVVVYMFCVGVDLDLDFVRRNLPSGAAIALSGIAMPLALGALLAMALVGDPRFFPQSGHRWVGVVFMAAATAVTAFPVLARILTDHGLLGTPVANLCLVSGSVSDVTAWALLAVALAGLSGPGAAAIAIVGAVIVTGVIAVGTGPALRRLGLAGDQHAPLSGRHLGALMLLLMAAALATEVIGIHPAFGAFLLGAACSRHARVRRAAAWLSPLVAELLLPVYFTYAGLHTMIGLIDSPAVVAITLAVIAIACLGKGVTCAVAALLARRAPREALAVGVLMNARGLVELVILTIGLDRGIITPTLFAIMVTMTIATTLIPSPVLRWLYPETREHQELQLAA